MTPYNRNQLAKESELSFEFVERVIRKMNLKPIKTGNDGKPYWDLEEFTEALEKYRARTYQDRAENDNNIHSLENEKLREVIRGLRLKNNILANKLISRDDVYEFIGEYISSELNRVKLMCLQQLVLKGRNKSAKEIRQLANELYNRYVIDQKDFTKKWIEKTKMDREVIINE